MTDQAFIGLILIFRAILDSREKLLSSLCEYGVQTEGWLKAEILCFLDEEKSATRIADFDREVVVDIRNNRKKVDLRVRIPTDCGESEAFVELKHWLIGYQKGYKYNANFYFRDPTSVGIRPDAERLSSVLGKDKFLLILTTANPGVDDWASGVNEFNRKFYPLHIESLTNAAEFPPFYYLGCLNVSKEEP